MQPGVSWGVLGYPWVSWGNQTDPVLFLFRCREMVRDPPNSPRSVICWDLFLYFWGDTLLLQMGDTVGPRYTPPKIFAISYLFRTFSLSIMGDTERPRYTGFRGLSVRGITALQCTYNAT